MKPRPPGLLRPGVDPDVAMMVCTAGHVDHGKTSLVKLLTGCNTDRLKEEQERGLTIELGFAPCFLGGNLCVGIVDVPGHEKFVKNMVAGVSGIDMTILVVAADDGIMPQTVEHFQIMELLGVRHGLVALTKTDLAAKERVEEVASSIREFLQGTFMANAPICPVSSETGDGYFEFYEVLVNEVKGLARLQKPGIFRMPVERVFLQKGFGTVVTGIPVDGAVEVGAQVELVPGGQTGKVRSIQRFLRDASEGGYGQCLALNIPDFGKPPPVRGQVIAAPGCLRAASCFHVRLKTVPGLDRPLRNAEEIKFHTGTSEEPGKVYLLEDKELGERRSGLATVLAHHPVAAAMFDRFILRRPSPAITVAGGEILAVSHAPQRLRKGELLPPLKSCQDFFEGVDLISVEGLDKRVEYFLKSEAPMGAAPQEISRGALLPVRTVGECLVRLCESGKALQLQPDAMIHAETYHARLREAQARIEKAAEEDKVLSLSASDVRQGLNWPQALWDRVQDDLVNAGLVTVRGGTLVLTRSLEGLRDADRELLDRILRAYEDQGFQSPRPDELPATLGADPKDVNRLLDYLCNEGKLVRLNRNVVLSRQHFKQAQDQVVQIIREKGALDSADFKYVIGSTRKYALAILDYLDARRVTVRVENDRKLAPNYQRNLV